MFISAGYHLKTKRLGFRCWTAEDLPLALAIWGDPEVTRFVGGPSSVAKVRKKLQREMANMRDHRVQYWPMFLLTSGEHIGCAGLRPYGAALNVREMGYYLRPVYWGMGTAEEAGRAVIDVAFTRLSVNTLIAAHHPANARSRRVLEKLGFRFGGVKLYPPTGLMHPTYVLQADQ